MTTTSALEIKNLSALQNKIHLVENEEEPIESIFLYEFRRITKYSLTTMKLDSILGTDAEVTTATYTANNNFHALLYTYMRQYLPNIRVKKEALGGIKICWNHNMGSAVTLTGFFKHNDEIIGRTDGPIYDIFHQFLQENKPGASSNKARGLGALSFLETWADELPAYTTNVEQPFYYRVASCLAFPLMYCSSLDRVIHKYSLRNSITSLLRMAKMKEGGSWEQIPTDLSLLDGVPSDGKLPTPELWGCYGYMTPKELEHHRCKEEISYFIDDFVIVDRVETSNSVLLESSYPCKSIFWMAENTTTPYLSLDGPSNSSPNISNYSTDASNVYRGANPCRRSTLKYGDNYKFGPLESDHFDITQPRHHFPSCPTEFGYNAYSFSYKSSSIDAESGVVFDGLKAKLIVDLPTKGSYNLHVRLLVTKELNFKKGGDGKYIVSII